ncbi:hypothetical protein BD410DRAFT_780327 [Rickenella mellea]|uniref:Velvet domain-containing protein n=1 Tax=Rickenella mellea TaxID=50990 RepID=A0A4R5XGC0_9AGAM|nr:hypothetical protein BD410DRAFT_780327 [Rickenella mellea]
MIQKTNARHGSTAVTAAHPGSSVANENPEQTWGSWSGTKHYSLEVIQQPLRARMCGFGDKDRRPLAPAAVAKMVVRRDDNSIVDVDDIDVAFFVVTVDLWSADGRKEMNLVLHPSSADRYVPAHVTKPRRRVTTSSAPPQRADATSSQSAGAAPLTPAAPGYASAGYPFPAHPAPGPQPVEQAPFPPPYAPHTDPSTSWNYHHQHLIHPGAERGSLPPINSFNRGGSPHVGSPWHPDHSSRDNTEAPAYRGWSSDAGFHADTTTAGHVPPHPQHGHPPHYPPEAYVGAPPVDPHAMYAPAPYGHPQPPHPSLAQYTPAPSSPSPSTVTLPRHSYTRTLVGPLSANACRLLDEHRKPGIFFLFQDLSIRTEGSFRLRLRLMNVGAPPAPEPGALRVSTGISPILAQTFTDPFVVYSAKRFPGVPDTTALSIAFGNQGQKLPLRNRHGSRQQGRRRRRGDSDGSDDDSDGR